MMSRVITLDKGSKKRLKQIRWSIREIVSAVLLSLILSLLGVLYAVWEVSHSSAESSTHQVKALP
jgi:hypothetical protein